MTNVIILHGKPDEVEYFDPSQPSPSNFAWIPWLQKKCVINGLSAATPEVFQAFKATYEDWQHEFERYDVSEETILVGHSCGGGFLLRWLSEHKNVRVKKLILVAPWLDPLGFMKKTYGFELFDFIQDADFLKRTQSCVVFHSDNDGESIQESIRKIHSVWPELEIRDFHNYGHFCPPEVTDEFPELLEEILR